MKKISSEERKPSKMPAGSPLLRGALVAAALSAPGCVSEDSSDEMANNQDMATSAETDMEVVSPMPPPMVMPEQDMSIVSPMPPPMHNNTDRDQLPPMPYPDDMHVDLPPMPEPADADVVPNDAEAVEDMEIIPPMPRPMEDMEVRRDCLLYTSPSPRD